MNAISTLPAIAGGLGLVLALAGFLLIARRRLFLGLGPLVAGVALLTAAAAVGAMTATFVRLSHEAPVAEVRIRAVDPAARAFMVTIVRLDRDLPQQDCAIEGDEWLISGRVQKWRPWANLLGLDATYDLDQLSNKYRSAAEANGRLITACDLEPDRSALTAKIPAWLTDRLFLVDRRFGSANYMKLADGAAYRVVITQSGFNAEPANDAAREASR